MTYNVMTRILNPTQEAGMAHSDCRWTCGCAGKMWDPLRTHGKPARALLRWCFATKRRYIKYMHLTLKSFLIESY